MLREFAAPGFQKVNDPARPAGVVIDLLFRHAEGDWRLFGIGVAPAEAAEPPDAESEPPQPTPKPAGSGG